MLSALRRGEYDWIDPQCRLRHAAWAIWSDYVVGRRRLARANQVVAQLAPGCSRVEPLRARTTSPVSLPPDAAALNAWLGDRQQRRDASLPRIAFRAWFRITEIAAVATLCADEKSAKLEQLRALRARAAAWNRWWRGLCAGARLKRLSQITLARRASASARNALRRLHSASLDGSTMREHLRMARRYLRLARLLAAMRWLAAAPELGRLQASLRLQADFMYKRSLCRKSIFCWRLDPCAKLRADRCFLAASFRRWHSRIKMLVRSYDDALCQALDALMWLRAWPRFAWRHWCTVSRLASSKRHRVQIQADERWKEGAKILLKLFYVVWHARASIMMRVRCLIMQSWARHLASCVSVWRSLVSLKQDARACAVCASTHFKVQRKKRLLWQWAKDAWISRKQRETAQGEMWQLLCMSLEALRKNCEAQRRKEKCRRIATRWRYNRLLAKALLCFQRIAARSRALPRLEEHIMQKNGRDLIERSLRAWTHEVRPALRISAVQRRTRGTLHTAFSAMRNHALIRRDKIRAARDHAMIMSRYKARLTFKCFREELLMRIKRRSRERAQTLVCCSRSNIGRRSRAFQWWSDGFMSIRRAAACRCAAAQRFCVTHFYKSAWLAFCRAIHIRRQAMARSTAHFLLRLRSQVSCWLRVWYIVANDLRIQKGLTDNALVHWYVTLCASSLRGWVSWLSERRRKRQRQLLAANLYAEAQRSSAARLLLWTFDDRCSRAEDNAIAHARAYQRLKVERASAAASRWKGAAARKRCSVACRPPLSTVCAAERLDTPLASVLTATPGEAYTLASVGVCTATPTTAASARSPELLHNSWTPSLASSWPSAMFTSPSDVPNVDEAPVGGLGLA